MNLKKRILYIGGGRKSEILETLKIAKSLGLEILYIQHKEKFSDSLLPYVDKVFLFNFEDEERLVSMARSIFALFPFDISISINEHALVHAAIVREALDMPGNSAHVTKLLKNKHLMRQRLHSAGLSPVHACLGNTREDLMDFVDKHGLPCVVKPVDSAGSWGVIGIHHVDQVEETWQKLQELGLSSFLMEEYLDGPEFSVETFTFHGKHVMIGVTEKITSNFIEIGHSIPAQLNEETYSEIETFTKSFLDLIELREGPAHTEIKLTKRGPRVVESHDRPGGGRISKLLEITYGLNLKAMTLAWFCGLIQPLEESPQVLKGSALRVLTPPPGIVKEIKGVDEIQQSEGLVELYIEVKEGSMVPPITKGQDRIAWIITEGVDVYEAINRCENLVKKVQIITEMN